MNQRMVPNLTPYKLAIKTMIDRVEIRRENEPSKECIGKFLYTPYLVIQYTSLVRLTT